MEQAYLAPELAERLGGQDLLRWAESVEGEVFREVKGRCTLRVQVGGRAYFLKRHRGVGWLEILKNWAVGKRPVLGAANEYLACRHLAARNLPAPRVAAFATEGGNPARRRSFVLCEELTGYDSLESVAANWAEQPPSPLARRRLIVAAARFVRRLHEAGVAHRDLYICHLMLHRQCWAQGEARLAVLDLHRARLQPKLYRDTGESETWQHPRTEGVPPSIPPPTGESETSQHCCSPRWNSTCQPAHGCASCASTRGGHCGKSLSRSRASGGRWPGGRRRCAARPSGRG